MKRKIVISIFAIVVFLVATAGAFLQEAVPDLTDLGGVILWLATVGAPYFVGWALSLLIENWKGWSQLPRPVKFFIPMIASVLVAVGANILLQYPSVIDAVAPWFTIVMGAILGWLGTQSAYMKVKESEYGARFQ